MGKLLERFGTFIKTQRGFESIDELMRDVHLPDKKHADYLLWERQVIIEQKVLVVDPADRPQKFLDELIERGASSRTAGSP